MMSYGDSKEHVVTYDTIAPTSMNERGDNYRDRESLNMDKNREIEKLIQSLSPNR